MSLPVPVPGPTAAGPPTSPEPFSEWASRQRADCFRRWHGRVCELGATWDTFRDEDEDASLPLRDVPPLAARDLSRLARAEQRRRTRAPTLVAWDRDDLPLAAAAGLREALSRHGKVVQFRGYCEGRSVLSTTTDQQAELQLAGCELVDCALNGGEHAGGGRGGVKVKVPMIVDAIKFAYEHHEMFTICFITDRIQDYGYLLATIKRSHPNCRILLMTSGGPVSLPQHLHRYVDLLLDWAEHVYAANSAAELPHSSHPNYDVWRMGPPMDGSAPIGSVPPHLRARSHPDLSLMQIQSQDARVESANEEVSDGEYGEGIFDEQIFASDENDDEEDRPSPPQSTATLETSSHEIHVESLKRMLKQDPKDKTTTASNSNSVEFPLPLTLSESKDNRSAPPRPPPGLDINGISNAGQLRPFPANASNKINGGHDHASNGAQNGTENGNKLVPVASPASLISILPMELKSGELKKKDDAEMLAKIIRSISKHSRIGPALKQTVCTKLRQEEPMRFRGKASLREFIATAVENGIVKETSGPDGKELLTMIIEEDPPPISLSDKMPVAYCEVPDKAASMARALHFVLFIATGSCPSGKSFPNKAYAQNIPRCTVLMFSSHSDAINTIEEFPWLRIGVLVDWRKMTKACASDDMSDEEDVPCEMCMKAGKKPTMVERGDEKFLCQFCVRTMEENRRYDTVEDIVRRVEQGLEQLVEDDMYRVSLPLVQKYLMSRHPDLITSRARALASVQEAIDAGTVVADDAPKRTVCLARVFEEANRPVPSRYDELDTTKVQNYIVRVLQDHHGWMARHDLNVKLKSKFGSKMGTPAARLLAFAEGVEKKKFHIGTGAFGQTVVLKEDGVSASLQAMEDRWIRSQAGYGTY